MSRIKRDSPKVKAVCTNCFKSNHIVFSFAYVTYCENFDSHAKETLVERIQEISSVNYLELMRWDKYKGFEEERVRISKAIPEKFNSEIKEFDGKYSIMRLYKGNTPTPGRIIGKLINKVFYIFYIDAKGDLYNH